MPFEVPEGWVWESIGNLCSSLQYGTSEKSLSEGKVAVLRMGNISPIGELIYEDLVFTSNDNDIFKYTLILGDLLFNRTNSSEWVGKTAIYRGEIPAIYAGYIIRFRPIFLNLEYVHYVMNSNYEKEYCQSVKTDGVNQSNINSQKLANFFIPIPPLQEQSRIVSKIKECFTLIDQIEEKKLSLTQFIKQTKFKVLDLAIHGKLVPQNPDDEPASVLLEQSKKEHKPKKLTADISHYPFKVPESWAWTTLGKIVLSIKNGATIKQNKNASGIPITRIETISDGTVNYVRMGYANIFDSLDYASYILKDNDILMSHINSPVHVGKTAIYKPKEKNETIIHGMNLLCIRLQDTISSDFVNYFFNSQFFKDSINPYIKNAVNQASINISNLNSIQIPVPPLTEQHQIVSKIEQIFVQLNEIENSITN